MSRFLFIRHGECEKNLDEVTGGDGAKLTERGVRQAERSAAGLAAELAHPTVLACPATQTVETAAIIARVMGCDYRIESRLAPADMGVVGGLKQTDIEARHPEYAEQLLRWRRREIEAHELRIRGIEPPARFWARMMAVLRAYDRNEEVVVVATRSIMVFAANLAMGRTPEPGGGYKHVSIGHCQTVTVSR
ncbi:histidine phosphatase family protein [Micromonospora sp. NPDC018662]|uniref:histidine phosphatase family protein n=1 Tax=Micromonospora sp. NPDC018662 TaxID=3364238 RepID=UPI00378E9BDF